LTLPAGRTAEVTGGERVQPQAVDQGRLDRDVVHERARIAEQTRDIRRE
jgi:hypothetical protein